MKISNLRAHEDKNLIRNPQFKIHGSSCLVSWTAFEFRKLKYSASLVDLDLIV